MDRGSKESEERGVSEAVLTVQREHGVEDLALHLSGTLRGAAHPQPLVQPHSRDDGISCVRRLLPLRQGGGGDDADPAAKCQEVTQELETRVGHPCLLRTFSLPCFAYGSSSFSSGTPGSPSVSMDTLVFTLLATIWTLCSSPSAFLL